MGGAAGHLAHLYDNPELTFGQIKDIFTNAASGKILGTEKTDGINLFLSFSNKDGKAKAARNKGDLKSGGMDAEGVAKKFADRGSLEKTFNSAMQTWEAVIGSLSGKDKMALFGPDANTFYNVEIQDPEAANVILYDAKNLVIHPTGHVELDNERNPVQSGNTEKKFQLLSKLVSSRQQKREQQGGFEIVGNAVMQLRALSSGQILKDFIKRLQDLQKTYDLSDSSNVQEFVYKSTISILRNQLPQDISLVMADKLTGRNKETITSILKKTPDKLKEKVKEVNDRAKEILKDAIFPLEDIVHDFSIEMLKGLKSAFILDNDKEVKRLRQQVDTAIKHIQASGDEEYIKILNAQLKKLKSADNVYTAAEGFVFVYDGLTYKFTGNFAPVNQILGIFKYGRGKKAPPMVPKGQPVQEAKKTRVVAVFPGGFKPAHIGHFLSVKNLAANPKIDEVKILISPMPRTSKDKSVVITAQKAKMIWDILTGNIPKVSIEISAAESPVKASYDEMENLSSGDTMIMVMGEKDVGDTRFSRAQDWANKNHPGLKIKTITSDVPSDIKDISASGLRELIAQKDKVGYFKFLPKDLEPGDKEDIWRILTNKRNSEGYLPRRNEMIGNDGQEETKGSKVKHLGNVEEVSGAGGGAVTGAPEVGKKVSKLVRRESLFIDRNDFLAELLLREKIRELIKENSKAKQSAEQVLRERIQSLILQEKSDVPDTTNASTGINVLEDLLKKIIPQIEQDYKSLTTSKEQRVSFRAHILSAVNKTLSAADMNQKAGAIAVDEAVEMEEEIMVDVGGDDEADALEEPGDEKFIDINDKPQMSDDEMELQDFTIPGQNETGRNMAVITYDKIEKNILDSYDILGDPEDQEVFYDYLLANLRLHMEKFEDEMSANLKEPKAGSEAARSANKESDK